MSAEAFFVSHEHDVFEATVHTQGPWDARFQHGGPPAALLVRQLEQCGPRPDMLLARVSIDIFGPVPIARLQAQAKVVRPGRSVELVEATLSYEERTVMRATGWRIKLPETRPPVHEPVPTATPLPSTTPERELRPEWDCGFLRATEWRPVKGDYAQLGAAISWTRLRYPLLEGEVTTPAQRLIAAADSANGISSPLDIRQWQFIPPSLSIHSLRPVQGEWICLDATTLLQTEGVGLTVATLFDEKGMVGRSDQPLLISKRTQQK